MKLFSKRWRISLKKSDISNIIADEMNSFPFSQGGSHRGFKAMEKGGLSASTQRPWLLLDPPEIHPGDLGCSKLGPSKGVTAPASAQPVLGVSNGH